MTQKKYFVLDLFVINAIVSNDLDLYFKTAALLQIIIDKCHKIVLSPSLKREYLRRLNNIEKRREYKNDKLLKYLKKIVINSDKVVDAHDLSYKIRVEIPRKDLPIIKTALAKSGNTIIVTTNKKHLIDNLELQKFLREANIKIFSLDETSTILNN